MRSVVREMSSVSTLRFPFLLCRPSVVYMAWKPRETANINCPQGKRGKAINLRLINLEPFLPSNSINLSFF